MEVEQKERLSFLEALVSRRPDNLLGIYREIEKLCTSN
jgi:DNA polymerase III delta subunit